LQQRATAKKDKAHIGPKKRVGVEKKIKAENEKPLTDRKPTMLTKNQRKRQRKNDTNYFPKQKQQKLLTLAQNKCNYFATTN
jgi:hypothetical protein